MSVKDKVFSFLEDFIENSKKDEFTTRELILAIRRKFKNINNNTLRSLIPIFASQKNSPLKHKSRGIYIKVKSFKKEKDIYTELLNFLKRKNIISVGIENREVLKNYRIRPDILGILKDEDFYKFSIKSSIVSVEVKTQDENIFKAFGQSSFYKLFSHYIYICIPENVKNLDMITHACFLNEIGLITYKSSDGELNFNILLPAKKINPIESYVIEVLKVGLAKAGRQH